MALLLKSTYSRPPALFTALDASEEMNGQSFLGRGMSMIPFCPFLTREPSFLFDGSATAPLGRIFVYIPSTWPCILLAYPSSCVHSWPLLTPSVVAVVLLQGVAA